MLSPPWEALWALLSDYPRLVGLGFVALLLAIVAPKASPPIGRLWLILRGARNGNGNEKKKHAREEPSGETSGLPLYMTRTEGEELEKLVRTRTHDIAGAAQMALSKADVVDRRQDKHSRILMEVQKEFAEHRGETRARLDGVVTTCEAMKGEQKEQRTLLQAMAVKLGVE